MIAFRLSASVAALALATPAAAQLSAPEQLMMQTVVAGFDGDAALLTDLVSVNSGTGNHAGVRQVADMVAPHFADLGFAVEWIDQSAQGRAGHLFARRQGAPGMTRMLLIAHLDTVFELTSPFQQVTREGNTLIGPGVGDDKGGIVVILAALRAMQAAGTLDGANIVVAMTGDEESAGSPIAAARADLVAAGEWADVALDFEGLWVVDGVDMGSVARRSSNSWMLTTSGREGHSSQVFSEGSGYGAIYEMARVLDAFRRELPEADLTYNAGLAGGGTDAVLSEDGLTITSGGKTNIIPDTAIVRGDLRTISPEQTDRVVTAMRAIVDQNLPGTDAEISFSFRYPPMPATPGNLSLLDRMNAVNADMGLPAMPILPPAERGAGDINFVAPHTDGLIGLGTAGDNMHAPGESVDLTSITRQAQRAAILMSRLAAMPYSAE